MSACGDVAMWLEVRCGLVVTGRDFRLSGFEHVERRRIMVEQSKRTADGTARRGTVPGLIFLKGARATADYLTRRFLREAKLLTDAARSPPGSSKPSVRAFSRFNARSETFMSAGSNTP
jgi:hypothetical protein